jgi:CheY-like chemotaxis protein
MSETQVECSEQNIIIADDSRMIRDILRFLFEGDGRHVWLASGGEEAVELARAKQAQLVMLDVRMPRMDGIDACRRIRALPHYGKVPIVMLTAYDDLAFRHEARRAGATTVIAKPFTSEQLRRDLAVLLAAG